jgi:hypothetical protein
VRDGIVVHLSQAAAAKRYGAAGDGQRMTVNGLI